MDFYSINRSKFANFHFSNEQKTQASRLSKKVPLTVMEMSNLSSSFVNPSPSSSSTSSSASNLTFTLVNTTTSDPAYTFNPGRGSSIAAVTAGGGGGYSVYLRSSLKALNKASYKISKPAVVSRSSNPSPNLQKMPLPVVAPVSAGVAAAVVPGAPPQPPVYNIDKNDFRDVVQKLTGSPAHRHGTRPVAPSLASPAAATPVAPSRLHRIRPPPLAHLAPSLPPPPLGPTVPQPIFAMDPWIGYSPLSPLPPLPTVSAASESPISAYKRRLHAASGGGQVGLATAVTAGGGQPSGLGPMSSPLGFGCVPSPRTAYQMMMAPGLSPTSPGVQLSSPRLWEL